MTSDGSQQVLLFSAGGLRLGVFLVEVTRLLEEQPLTAVPFAHPALIGLLDAGDIGPVPVFDLGRLVHPQAPVSRSVLGAVVALFSTERGPIGLRMDEMRGTTTHYRYLEAGSSKAPRTATAGQAEEGRSEALPEVAQRSLTGVAESEEGPFHLFSPDAFVVALDLGQAGRPARA